MVIYKLSDADKDDSHGQYLEMQEYIEQHPETVVIDPISAVHTVTSRLRTCDFLDNLVLSLRNKAYQLNNVDKEGAYGCDGPHKFTSPFRQPEYAKVDDIHQLRKCIASGKLTFPIICKPIHACGIPSSHLMVRIHLVLLEYVICFVIAAELYLMQSLLLFYYWTGCFGI